MAYELVVVPAGDGSGEVGNTDVLPPHSGNVRCRATATVPLSLGGIAQAMAAGLKLARRLGGATEATYWAPPHLRSLQTARIAASVAGSEYPIQIDGRLSPIPLPEGLSEAELYSHLLKDAHAICGVEVLDPAQSMRSFLEAVHTQRPPEPAVIALPSDQVPLLRAVLGYVGRATITIHMLTVGRHLYQTGPHR